MSTIDSAEVVDEKTVYTERLFFSGYYEKWYILPSSFMEFQQDVVATVIPELTNTRLRRIIQSMPPYSPETVLDFGLIQAHGVFANFSLIIRRSNAPTRSASARGRKSLAGV